MSLIINEKSKFKYKNTPSKTYELLIEGLQGMKNWKLADSDQDSFNLTYKVKVSPKSWGEKVVINISKEKDDGVSCIEVHSSPIMPTTILDYGKNRANIDTIKDILNVDY